jgi:polyisoprenoid-binding protein YceI
MSRNTVILIAAIAFGLGIGVGALGLLFATGNVAPSGASGAATLDPNILPTENPVFALSTENADLQATITGLSAEVEAAQTLAAEAAVPQAVETEEVEATDDTATDVPATEAAPTEAPDAEPTEATDASSSGEERVLYRISQDGSEARFLIDETISGNEIIVVGATSSVEGDIIVNFSNPMESQVGEIAVNARTLRTDTELRDQSLRGLILNTQQYEFIRFAPTAFNALSSDPVSVGDTLEFEITGDVTVRDVTRSVTFAVTVTVASEDRIEGIAVSPEIPYTDFNLSVRPPPNVSFLGDTVTLELEFVAERVE